jgi:hypothetical protein
MQETLPAVSGSPITTSNKPALVALAVFAAGAHKLPLLMYTLEPGGKNENVI